VTVNHPGRGREEKYGLGGSVARVWHEGAAIRQARAERISEKILEQQKMGAGDGNRTRMTSLEDRSLGLVADLRERWSW
jgi:hypothetical protein